MIHITTNAQKEEANLYAYDDQRGIICKIIPDGSSTHKIQVLNAHGIETETLQYIQAVYECYTTIAESLELEPNEIEDTAIIRTTSQKDTPTLLIPLTTDTIHTLIYRDADTIYTLPHTFITAPDPLNDLTLHGKTPSQNQQDNILALFSDLVFE